MSIDLSLDRVRELVVHLQAYTRPTLHIAGTNGKGTVSALLTSILLSANPPLCVGRFNSPHLVSVYDCITIDDVPVSSSLYDAVRAEVEDADKKHQTRLSNFEILTLVALQIFEKTQMDVVVLEVGMGGRLDATNVVPDEVILVSALTAVDLDHQAFLGDTVTKIAQEKAGIGRRGRPFVLGKQRHSEVKAAVQGVLSCLGPGMLVDAVQVRTREWIENIDGVRPPAFSLASPFQPPAAQPISANLPCFTETLHALLPLHGTHQLDNLGTSLAVINELLSSPTLQGSLDSLRLKERINIKSVAKGIQNVRWPGRLSFHTLNPTSVFVGEPSTDSLVVLVDGAHNAASAATLGEYITHLLGLAIASSYTSWPITIHMTFVIALSHSPPKTPREILSPFLPLKLPNHLIPNCNVKTRIILLPFTPPDGMPWVKPVPPEDMEVIVRDLVPEAELLIEVDLGSTGDQNSALESAFKWISQRRHEDVCGVPGKMAELVVLAGSLYLVADFYRILQLGRFRIQNPE